MQGRLPNEIGGEAPLGIIDARGTLAFYHGAVLQNAAAPIGVIGGSGLYRLTEPAEWRSVTTPHGDPSDAIALGSIRGEAVAFLPRHGRTHTVPPHRINHRANIWALHSLGVRRIIGPCAVGSLRPEVRPGDVVICDQFIDHTGGRHESTFFDGPAVAHVTMADPYCAELRQLGAAACRDAGFTVHEAGTVGVVPGPRFSTRAESRRFRAEGADVINMTQYPEVALARELGMCYVTLSLVTDYDAGFEHQPDRPAVTQEEVMAAFARNTASLLRSIEILVGRAAAAPRCACAAGAARPLGH